MHDPEVDVELESRLEEADRDREYLRRQLAKYSEALVRIDVIVCHPDFGVGRDPIDDSREIAQIIREAHWTQAGDGER